MPFENEIAQLIPEGPGEVLWLGPDHAQLLVDGMPIAPGAKRAVVLQGLLGRFTDPALVLRQMADVVDEDGVVIALVASRLNPRQAAGFTRSELLIAFRSAGYDVTSCRLVRDDDVPWIPMSFAPTPGAMPAADLEERASGWIVVGARRPPIVAPACSLITLGPLGAALPKTSTSIEVIEAREPNAGRFRSRRWNGAVRMAKGRWLAFVDTDCSAKPGWLDRLLATIEQHPNSVVGGQALAFGPRSLPCHNLPYPVPGATAGPVSAVDACGMLIAREAFVEAGGFDEQLGSEHDGADLCLRLLARGFEVVHAPAAAVKQNRDVRPPTSTSSIRHFAFRWRGQIPESANAGAPSKRGRKLSAPAPILWSGPVLQNSGYGEEARNFVLALDQLGIAVRANPTEWHGIGTDLRRSDARRLSALVVTDAPDRFINVVNSFPIAHMSIRGADSHAPLIQHFKPHPKAVRNIGRTMYETDRIPPMWVDSCNQMDEVWVPSQFNVDTFSKAGVMREKLHVIPGGLDVELFDPSVAPIELPEAQGFVFLSVFAWSLRKGWDVLVRAFVEEFSAEEPVTLAMKARPSFGHELEDHAAILDDYMRKVLGYVPGDRQRVILLGVDPGSEGMARLYRSAHAFVLPSRGESYGRPFLEAMAMGLPTIGPRLGGNRDFMTDENSYLVDCTMVDVPPAAVLEWPDYQGHRWAEPDVDDLRRVMRRVFEEREEAREKGARAREDVIANHSLHAVARAVVARLEASNTAPLRARLPERTAVTWEGPNEITFGIAEVNRELGRALAADQRLDVKPSESPDDYPWMTGRPAEVTVRHQWPPNFEPPRIGRLVTYQPWEFGSLPAAWIEPMNRLTDEVWVPTTYVRDCFVRSGVDGERVKVVPYGVDPSRFHPGARPIDLPTSKKHRFLFVGGTIARKGADILLETYMSTFNAGDDVCLVVRDLGGKSFYSGQGLGAWIRRQGSDPSHPEILYLEDDLPAGEMPGLYTACQCLVHPYRGEGFGLPIVEAMACGLAVIVPRHGACLDYCDDASAYLVKAKEVRLLEPRVGDIPTVERPWWAEVDRVALARAMRRVVAKPAEARAKGLRASARIRREVTWERAAEAAASRIVALAGTPERQVDLRG